MKKKLTLFILIPSLLISSSIYANSLLGTVGEIYVAKKVLNHKKLVLGGALLVGIGSFAGYKITKEKFLDMIEHPQDHEDMMLTLIQEHPLKFNAFKAFLNYNVEKTDDMEYKQNILDFEDYYHIGNNDEVAYKIESSSEYKNYLSSIKTKINEIESELDKSKMKCDNAYYQKLANSPIDFPNNLKLTEDGNNNIYAVNRYGFFPEDRTGYTPDHIPSYKAIHNFLVSQGISLEPKRPNNKILDKNLTAITIITNEHQAGSRTYGGRNIQRSIEDSKNLKLATAKDIAFFSAYLILFKFKDPTDYIKSNETLIKRNFYLCLYN